MLSFKSLRLIFKMSVRICAARAWLRNWWSTCLASPKPLSLVIKSLWKWLRRRRARQLSLLARKSKKSRRFHGIKMINISENIYKRVRPLQWFVLWNGLGVCARHGHLDHHRRNRAGLVNHIFYNNNNVILDRFGGGEGGALWLTGFPSGYSAADEGH